MSSRRVEHVGPAEEEVDWNAPAEQIARRQQAAPAGDVRTGQSGDELPDGTAVAAVRQREHQLHVRVRKGGSDKPDEMQNVLVDTAALTVLDTGLGRVDADAHYG